MIDKWMIDVFDRLAARLQNELGVPLPSILKNAMMAVVTSMILKIMFEALAGATTTLLVDLVLVAATGRQVWRRLMILSRHENEAWNARLAMLYQASAIAQREFMLMRVIRLLVVIGFGAFDVPHIVFMAMTGPTPLGMLGIALSVALIADLYFACAMPHTPSRREKRETFFEAAPFAA